MSNNSSPRKILFLAANPIGTSRLRLDQEVREITEGLWRSRQRDHFFLNQRWAVRAQDIRRAILDDRPQIVHFAGHGTGEEGIILENYAGNEQLVTAEALAGLFELFADQVECVFLNACYSEVQADAIAQQVPYVIGMKRSIGDKAAIEFAVGFYDGLGAGKSIEFAYRLGCNAIQMAGIPEELIPTLKKRFDMPSSLEVAPVKARFESQKVDRAKVFISYRSKEPDLSLAKQFYQSLDFAGHEVFMAGESIRLGEDWAQRIDTELESCDYFLLLLSSQSATSEMVTEEVRRAKQLQDIRSEQKPVMLPIRVNLPMDAPLNYDLRGYLQRVQQREWKSAEDTPKIVQEILSLIARKLNPTSNSRNLEESVISNDTQFLSSETLDSPPLPIAEPELPEGQVDLASMFYVERPPIEARCFEAISKPGALIRIKAPRQMGKTSLMARILEYAKKQDCVTVPLSFQIADAAVFNDLDKFLRWFCASVGRRLRLPNKLSDYWDVIFGSKDNCTAYFEEYLLKEINQPLALGLDEVDMVFYHPEIAADFFGMLRAWHEEAKNSQLWKKLRLVVVHSTEVYVPMNIHQSPFNVGLPINLPEFSAVQVQDLARRHGLSLTTADVNQLMAIIGGHPYLVRVALYHIARADITLERLIKTAPTEAGLYGDHLRRHLWNLEQHPEILATVKRIAASEEPIRLESIQAFQLHSMGLVNLLGNHVMFRSSLYQQYFRDRLRVHK
jgi:hypothetical protein